jgi:sporulation protein YlmC with PRC-barrel domain
MPDLMQTRPLNPKHVSPASPAMAGQGTNRELPIEAKVACTDGECGQSIYVLINPLTEQLTHLVVRENQAPHTEFLVPVEKVSGVNDSVIQLHCTRAEFAALVPFIQTEYITTTVPETAGTYGQAYATGQYFYLPYVDSNKPIYETIEHREIPLGEMAVRRGTRVEATDGHVGRVDEFVLNADSGHMTHFVMREGHLWAPKEVIIPISALDGVRNDTLFLKLDKAAVEALPTFPVKRHWA